MSDSRRRKKNAPRTVDLFCGCGGISSGLRDAGFDVIAGADIEPKYISTFRHNFAAAQTLTVDLSAEDPKQMLCDLSLRRGELDLLAGGPPCQGFSKNVPRRDRFLEQDNNTQVRTFLAYAEAWLPRFVLMENVAEMKNGFGRVYTDEVIERLSSLGYAVDYAVLNGADYGVPQRRRRAFFIGARDGLKPAIPEATHTKDASEGLFPSLRHVNVWDAIGDLPSIPNGGGADPMDYASAPQNDFQRRVRGNQLVVRNHVARRLEPTQYERLASLKPGEGLKQLPEHLKVKSGYSGAYGRLTEDMIAPTITRWVFHPGSGRFGHPKDIRVITIREAARIQGFPDSFEFVSTYVQQAGQVGNAVPPILASAIATAMMKQLV